jgi:biopolymer transport protein ExbB
MVAAEGAIVGGVQDSQAGNQPLEDANPTGSSDSNARPAGMNFLSLLTLGGWFMIPLGILSLAVVALIIERALALRRDRLLPEKLVRRLGQLSELPGGLDPREAYRICQSIPSTAASVFRNVLVKVGRPQMELENTMHESAQRNAIELQQTVSWLTLIAAVAPLLGLLGTVWGITQAFYDTSQLAVGQNRAEALAEGIYTALVTTICGLVIAIPATIAAHFFENRIITLLNQIEAMILSLLPQLERYEGNVRFMDESRSMTAESPRGSAQANDGSTMTADGELPMPTPRAGKTSSTRGNMR